MIRAAVWLAVCALGFAQAPPSPPPGQDVTKPAHVIAVYVDLDSAAASRAMVVLRAFTDRHPGVAAVELHLMAPEGRARTVDRAALAAEGQGAGLRMAELMLANQARRTGADFLAMARQLRLDEAQFTAALAADSSTRSLAADAATAASLGLPRDVAIVIDGQPLASAITLVDLERRLGQS